MEEHQSPPPIQQPLQKSKKAKSLLWILVAILLAGAVAIGVYAWKQQEVQELKAKIQELQISSPSNDENIELKKAPQLSEDDKVTAAFNRHCDAISVPEGFERNTVIGTMTPDQKKLVYSADKHFVALNGKCDFKKIGTNDEGGGSAAYIFKKVSDDWLVVVTTQQQLESVVIEKYGIPKDFLESIGLN